MTEEQRRELESAKAGVTEWLASYPIGRHRLGSVDARLPRYLKEVAARPRAHNLWEQLAVKKFLLMVERYGIDKWAVKRFFKFYESLKFPGRGGMQCYALTPVQAFQFASIYGFTSGGRRVVREALLYVPRKFSKTTGTASLAVYDLLYGEANAEVYVAANSADQAKKCFDVVRGCVRALDPQGRRYVVNKQDIRGLRADRTALAQCLTANARTKDGLNASTNIFDEFSQARDNGLYSVLTTSMGARLDPLTVIITTASECFDGPFYSMLQGYKAMLLEDNCGDPSVFAHIFEPDVGDAEGDEATWLKVHPHIGITVQKDYYRRQWEAAQRGGAEAMLAFRTKLLNVYAVSERASWISQQLALDMSRPITLADLRGYPVATCAFDLSESDDFTAVSFCCYDQGAATFVFHTAYFFPEGALAGHPNERLYRAWAQAGHLILTQGPVIDYAAVCSYIIGAAEHVEICGIGFDGWKSKDMRTMLESWIAARGADPKTLMAQVGQTYGHFTSPVEAFEHVAKTGRAVINDNPINLFCFGNAVLDYDKLDNCKPIKRSQAQKIDGVVTMLMALKVFMDRQI